jgi:hypothetical protein
MAESWAGEYLQMVEDCEKRESRINEWEQGFIDSVRRSLENEFPLSKKQVEALENIWEKATAKG